MLPTRPPAVIVAAPANLDRRATRRVVLASLARVVLSVVAIFGAYSLTPVREFGRGETVVRLVLSVGLVVVVLVWQFRRIRIAEHPVLRAVEAIAVAIPLFIVVFALVYLSLAHENPGSFNENLNHVSAVYYTVTVLTTVGFGDIVAKTPTARLTVTIQMLLDLALIGVIVKVLFGTAQAVVGRRSDS